MQTQDRQVGREKIKLQMSWRSTTKNYPFFPFWVGSEASKDWPRVRRRRRKGIGCSGCWDYSYSLSEVYFGSGLGYSYSSKWWYWMNNLREAQWKNLRLSWIAITFGLDWVYSVLMRMHLITPLGRNGIPSFRSPRSGRERERVLESVRGEKNIDSRSWGS